MVSQMSNIKGKILRTKVPLHSVLHKNAYFKINEVVNKKESRKLDSFAKEEIKCIYYLLTGDYIP